MTDPLAPPPRRPMPEHLERRIIGELAAVTSRRRRIGSVVIPLVAAAVVGAMVVVGTTAFRDRLRVEPAEPATPVATETPLTPTPSATATRKPVPKPVTVLNVRPMSKDEVAADRRSCLREDEKDHGPPTPRRGTPEVQYAMVQRTAGADGAGSVVRALLLEDEIGHWACENGQRMSWTRGARTSIGLSSQVPAAPVTNSGGSSASCSPEHSEVGSSGTFTVRRAVAIARVRVLRGKQAGPWMTVEPVDGLVHILVEVTGPAANERNVRVEYGFLDRNGRTVRVASGYDDGKTSTSDVEELATCADVRDMRERDKPKPVTRPSSDAAGIRTCRAMAEESANRDDSRADREWKSRLLVSTREEWGTVLSDGHNLVGCSLFPTKEISPFIPDAPSVRKAAFSFAVNPIGSTGASSLWAAGRVPNDVTAITYRLPGGEDIAASIDPRGYWMLKHHTAPGTGIGSQERSSDWPPVQVTVTRPTGATRYSIPFTEETMCRQVSHGC